MQDDTRAERRRVGRRANQPDSQPVIPARLLVDEQACRPTCLGHDDIQVAIPLDIGVRRTPTHERLSQVGNRFRR